jgi:hypothetical protein
MMSLIEAIERAPILQEPFPHVVIDGALPTEAYQALSKGWPSLETFVTGKPYHQNFRYNLFAKELMTEKFAPAVREFTKVHSSYALYSTVLRKFRGFYVSQFGEAKYRELIDEKRVGLRKRDSFETHDVLVDSTFAINTPNSTGDTTVRGPHIDKLFKLYGGLYYLRLPHDESTGGDLILYRAKAEAFQASQNDLSSTSGGARMEISPQNVEEVKTIPYAANRLVLYPNGVKMIHAVSVRSQTPVERRLITLVADYKEDVLDVT